MEHNLSGAGLEQILKDQCWLSELVQFWNGKKMFCQGMTEMQSQSKYFC